MFEIERKYLVTVPDPDRLRGYEAKEIEQGYVLVGDPEVRIRRRMGSDAYYLTVKKGSGLVRYEYECAVTPNVGEALFEVAGSRVLHKTRYILPGGWELDLFHGHLHGLALLEYELEYPHAEVPTPPPFLRVVTEVTEDPTYKNAALASGGTYQPLHTCIVRTGRWEDCMLACPACAAETL